MECENLEHRMSNTFESSGKALNGNAIDKLEAELQRKNSERDLATLDLHRFRVRKR